MSFLSMALAIEKTPPALDSDPADLGAVLGMRLSVFARSGSWLRIKSQVLGEDVCFAADNATGLPPGVPVYRAGELTKLTKLKPEELRAVHRIKTFFAGTVYDLRKKRIYAKRKVVIADERTGAKTLRGFSRKR